MFVTEVMNMNLFLLIYLPILLYAFKDYHKAFLLYAIIRPLLNFQILLYSMPGVPQIFLETFMNTFILICVCANYNSNKPQNSVNFPLKRVFFVYTIVICISSLASTMLLRQEISLIYQTTLNGFVFVYLLWRELKTLQDIKFFIKGIMLFSSVIVVYGFFELFSNGYNPLLLYEATLNHASEIITGDAEQGMGGNRGAKVRSIFFICFGYGTYMSVVLPFFYYIDVQYKKMWNLAKWKKIIFMSALFLALLSANCRGQILACLISLLFILKFKNVLRLSLFLPFFTVLFYGHISQYAVTILSIFSQSHQVEAGGSDMAMRLMQFALAIQVWEDRPWLGYGVLGANYWIKQEIGLLGMESIWLKVLVNFGIIGVISQIYLYYSMIKLGIGKSKRYVIGSLLGLIALETTTVSWGFDQYNSFLIGFMLIAYRLELLSASEKDSLKINNSNKGIEGRICPV
jgi:hypothetical protein